MGIKYERRDEAILLLSMIGDLETLLESISQDWLVVRIELDTHEILKTNVCKDIVKDDLFQSPGASFVAHIKNDLIDRIAKLKSEFENL